VKVATPDDLKWGELRFQSFSAGIATISLTASTARSPEDTPCRLPRSSDR
jgi:hypothetical protein